MKKPDIGLVLSGGGARGAYQLGVMAAIEKFHLYDRIKAVSGGSIGSFSSLLFLIRDISACYHIWKDMDSERVLGYKDSLTAKIPIKARGLFSRGALMSYIYRNFDLDKMLQIDIPIYSCCSRVIKRGIKKTYVPEYFLLNYKTHDFVTRVLLASSAIPLIFDAIEIDGKTYVDCLKSDNEPSKPLEQYELDYLFVVPLTSSHSPAKYRDSDIPVIDFVTDELLVSPMINMLEFDPTRTDYYVNLGYYVGCTLLGWLKDHNAFKAERQPRQFPNYVSLQSLGIKLNPQRIFTIEELVEDIKKGDK